MKLKDLCLITSRGSVTLFVVAFLFSLIVGSISILSGAMPITAITLTAIGGVLITMAISKAAGIVGMTFGISNNPGNLGTICALLLILMII